jgi:hypothetical protein
LSKTVKWGQSYIEGQNIAIEWRLAEEKLERYPNLMAEFGRLNLAVMARVAEAPIWTGKNATRTIPIVHLLH